MNKVTPRILSGFLELLPSEQMIFELMLGKLRDSFSLFGFAPLDTPLIEVADVLLAKGGGETEKQIYRFTKGDSDLALRFDLTVPLARYVAQHYSALTFPFRRYQIGKVYRGERAQRGRFREFYQADIDIIGSESLDIMSEAEIPSVIYKCFTALGLERFVIRVNNRKVLNGFFEILGTQDKAQDIMRVIDKLDKIGAESVKLLLTDEIGLGSAQSEEILSLILSTDALEALRPYMGKSAMFDSGAFEVETVAQHLTAFGVPDSHFKIDLTIARGLDYYTGTVYETILPDFPEIGSVCSGGRYDNLAGYYTDKKLPGVGISIGLTRLFYILNEQRLLNTNMLTSPADVLIIPMTQDLSHAVALATAMRAEGLRVAVYTENKKFKAKIAYADKLKIPFVVFLGEDEISAGVITVKDMLTGEQTTASPAILTCGILDKLSAIKSLPPIDLGGKLKV